jgi:hypothetical protein
MVINYYPDPNMQNDARGLHPWEMHEQTCRVLGLLREFVDATMEDRPMDVSSVPGTREYSEAQR